MNHPSLLHGGRLSDVDYVDEIFGLKWTCNSCWVDTPLWVAKMCGLSQLRCDEGFDGIGEVQIRTIELLRILWHKVVRLPVPTLP